MKLEIEKVLVISTAHITEKDCDKLCSLEDQDYPYTRSQTGYGVLVCVVSDMVLPPRENSVDFIKGPSPAWCKKFSKDFIEILRIAKENKCSWVNFDRDGSEVEGLPTHDW